MNSARSLTFRRAHTGISATGALPLTVIGALAVTLFPAPAHAAGADVAPAGQPVRADEDRMSLSAKTPAASIVPTHATPDDYVVQPGDTVSAIAARHGLRTVDVLALNDLGWSTVIYPGHVLRLTGAAPAPTPETSPAPAPAPATAATYTVTAGDTIFAIARAHGVSTDAVLAANGLQSSSIIYPGQSLAIPGPAAPAAPPAAPATPAPVLAVETVSLDGEQIGNVQLIIAVGREMGVSDRGIAIALGTAMQESWLRNLDWGDRDSLGLFQQRPSTGWGTPDEVRDPVRATRVFFGGAGDPNGSRTRGLLDIPGWEGMSYADAAQAVQISAYPDRYARWEAPAYAWLAAFG
jgi:LysM repeat protein